MFSIYENPILFPPYILYSSVVIGSADYSRCFEYLVMVSKSDLSLI